MSVSKQAAVWVFGAIQGPETPLDTLDQFGGADRRVEAAWAEGRNCPR